MGGAVPAARLRAAIKVAIHHRWRWHAIVFMSGKTAETAKAPFFSFYDREQCFKSPPVVDGTKWHTRRRVGDSPSIKMENVFHFSLKSFFFFCNKIVPSSWNWANHINLAGWFLYYTISFFFVFYWLCLYVYDPSLTFSAVLDKRVAVRLVRPEQRAKRAPATKQTDGGERERKGS